MIIAHSSFRAVPYLALYVVARIIRAENFPNIIYLKLCILLIDFFIMSQFELVNLLLKYLAAEQRAGRHK